MLVANCRMYDVAPACRALWHSLFELVARESGIPLKALIHDGDIADLWARSDLGMTFMCGMPYAKADPKPHLLGVPVPSLRRYGGQAVYFSEFLVRANSGLQSLQDTFGGRIGWMTLCSHSGFNAPRHHLLSHHMSAPGPLYSSSVGPLGTPLRSLDSLRRGVVDVVALDSYFMDLYRQFAPDLGAEFRCIEVTAAAPMPALVASHATGAEAVESLRSALLAVHLQPDGKKLLGALRIRHFAAPIASDYDVIISRQNSAHAANYLLPS